MLVHDVGSAGLHKHVGPATPLSVGTARGRSRNRRAPFQTKPPGRQAAGRCYAEEQERVQTSLDLPFESSRPTADRAAGGAFSKQNVLLRPNTLAPGTTLSNGKYTILEALGSGSTATTYRARASAEAGGCEVAIKALALKGLRDWKVLELFQREARVLQGLSHPGIPKYREYFEEDTDNDRSFYLVQDVAQGSSLASMLASAARPTEAEVERIARELLNILQYLQSLRPPVVHRDLKPENVVLEGGRWGGRVFLIDFGGVQGIVEGGENFALGSTIVGTYGYMAPEQFRGTAKPASDLYALGGTLLYLVSGQAPFAFTQERMRINYRDRVTVGPRLSQLLDGLLEPVAEDRLTAQEALDILGGRAQRQQRQQQQQRRQERQLDTRTGRYGSLQPRVPQGRGLRKPAGTRVQLTSSPNRLDVEIPPEGLTGSSASTGLFAVVWNAFVAFWTVSALASGGIVFALFSAPFWFAGAQLAGQAFGGALSQERLAIGRNKFKLAQELALLKGGVATFLGNGARSIEGDSADLTGARIITTMIVNGVPRTAIELVEGVNRHRFGEGLDPLEQEWLAGEINAHIEQSSGRAPAAEDMPPEDRPAVYDEDGGNGMWGSSDVYDDNDSSWRR